MKNNFNTKINQQKKKKVIYKINIVFTSLKNGLERKTKSNL